MSPASTAGTPISFLPPPATVQQVQVPTPFLMEKILLDVVVLTNSQTAAVLLSASYAEKPVFVFFFTACR